MSDEKTKEQKLADLESAKAIVEQLEAEVGEQPPEQPAPLNPAEVSRLDGHGYALWKQKNGIV